MSFVNYRYLNFQLHRFLFDVSLKLSNNCFWYKAFAHVAILLSSLQLLITKTSSCNEDPLTPHFYIVKLGFTGTYIIFLFLF